MEHFVEGLTTSEDDSHGKAGHTSPASQRGMASVVGYLGDDHDNDHAIPFYARPSNLVIENTFCQVDDEGNMFSISSYGRDHRSQLELIIQIDSLYGIHFYSSIDCMC
ncbi:MAG: hypothetical protein ACI8RD_009143 [Bacillariaceae sp.]|jgi:hypothetical protein